MNKPLLHYLCWLAVFSSCRNQGSHPHDRVRADSAVALNEVVSNPSKAAPVELDSSMVSLKIFGTLSLEDAMSQTWIFEDADKAHWDKIFWDSVTNTRQYPELALFPDHSALLNPRCGMKSGTWTLD